MTKTVSKPIDLAAIVEAGKLAKESADPTGSLAAKYALLAVDSADQLAAVLLRVKAIIEPELDLASEHWLCGYDVDVTLTNDEASEIARLLEGVK